MDNYLTIINHCKLYFYNNASEFNYMYLMCLLYFSLSRKCAPVIKTLLFYVINTFI